MKRSTIAASLAATLAAPAPRPAHAGLTAGSTWPDDVIQCCHYSESRRLEKEGRLRQLCEVNKIKWEDLDNEDDWPTFGPLKKKWMKNKKWF